MAKRRPQGGLDAVPASQTIRSMARRLRAAPVGVTLSVADLRERSGYGGAPVPGGRPQRRARRQARQRRRVRRRLDLNMAQFGNAARWLA